MTVRKTVHNLIDALPEDRLADVRDYIADLQDEDAALSNAVGGSRSESDAPQS